MQKKLKGRNFLKLIDFETSDLRYLLDLSKKFKKLKLSKTPHKYLEGKNIVLLFEKTSTRTRCGFEVAGYDLGMGVTYLEPSSSQMGKKESIKDTARVLGRMYDGIEYRGFSQEIVEKLGKYSGVPVWNGLTDMFHPTQMLADLLTIEEHFGKLKGLNFTFMGDTRNNVANSLMIACSMFGINFTACGPKELKPEKWLIDKAKQYSKVNDSKVIFTENLEKGLKNADIIYTDIWVSMGESDSVWEDRIKKLKPYQVNKEAMMLAKKDAIFLHCLPSFHDLNTLIGQEIYKKFKLSEMEVTDEVFESFQSKVFEQAENRMHTIKAIMYATLQ